jgi:hypothetical protein
MAQGHCRLFYNPEACFPAYAQRPFKALHWHMEFRLDKEEATTRLQKEENFPEEAGCIRDFVGHPEGENKISRRFNPHALLAAAVKNDPISYPCTSGPSTHDIQHLLLEIDSDDLPSMTGKLCQTYRKVTHSAADIDDSHPGLYIRVKQTLRIMKETAQGIVKAVAQPPWTNHIVYSLLCVPSQNGGFAVRLQPHQAAVLGFLISVSTGVMPVFNRSWDPSQNGWVSV